MATARPRGQRGSVVNDRKLVKDFRKVRGIKPQAIELQLKAPRRGVERGRLDIGGDPDFRTDGWSRRQVLRAQQILKHFWRRRRAHRPENFRPRKLKIDDKAAVTEEVRQCLSPDCPGMPAGSEIGKPRSRGIVLTEAGRSGIEEPERGLGCDLTNQWRVFGQEPRLRRRSFEFIVAFPAEITVAIAPGEVI